MAQKAKDIAKQLGVSTATLSLVINGKPGISDKTRKKVIQRLNELGYSDMIQQKEEAVKESKTIGFVLYKSNGQLLGLNSFFPLILDGIELTARQYGYNLLIINVEKQEIEKQIEYIKEANCAGIVVFATEMEDKEYYFDELNTPFVLFDNYFKNKEINSVKVNNEQGTYLLVKYLYEMGHRKIGYLDSGIPINSFKERQNCAFEAMKSFNMNDNRRYVFEIGYPHEKAEIGMLDILAKHDKDNLPTAFLSDNDLVAAGAIRAIKKLGYKIPQDFSIVGYDDRPICTLVEPQLTTIQLPRESFGAEAVEQLIRIIQGEKKACTKVEINGKLIVRDTVGKLNSDK